MELCLDRLNNIFKPLLLSDPYNIFLPAQGLENKLWIPGDREACRRTEMARSAFQAPTPPPCNPAPSATVGKEPTPLDDWELLQFRKIPLLGPTQEKEQHHHRTTALPVLIRKMLADGHGRLVVAGTQEGEIVGGLKLLFIDWLSCVVCRPERGLRRGGGNINLTNKIK